MDEKSRLLDGQPRTSNIHLDQHEDEYFIASDLNNTIEMVADSIQSSSSHNNNHYKRYNSQQTSTSTTNNINNNNVPLHNSSFVDMNPLGGSLETMEKGSNLEFTYWLMKKRQWSRLHRGTFSNEKRGFSFFWFLFFLSAYGIYLFLQIYHYKRGAGYILEFILMGFISISLGLLAPRFSWVVRVVFLEVYSTLYLFFILNLYYEKQYYIPLLTVASGALVVTIICFFVYPYIMKCYFSITGAITMASDKDTWVKGESNRFTIKQRNCFKKPTTCVYEGPLLDGRPHGIGTWMDTSYQGELLAGYWENGIPLGPFESTENDTRSLLVNLRIVYGTNGGGKSWLDRIPLHTGVAAVECCVSGNFFKGYPKVSMIKGPDHCNCNYKKACTCLKSLFENGSYRHIDDDKTLSSVVVSKQNTVTIQLVKNNQVNGLALDSHWISSQSNEGLLFIHGYDHDLKDSLKRFAQFLALGHFPNYLKPFVFNWPSSTSSLLYWCAHSIASDNDNHRDLQRFIESLGHAGIRTLHVMCHSMGTRFFLRSFSKVKKAFNKRQVSLSPNSSLGSIPTINETRAPYNDSKINLANLIFLNPDYEIQTFKNDYDELRSYCPRISIYADHRDVAIKLAFKMLQKQNLGNNIQPILSDDTGQSLDVDIIDTGDLDSNMSERHHSFFNINRLMVDDLHDLIVTGKRAEERTSRLKSVGDVYRFSILPSSVVVV
ncbi:hypothetical protein DFA_04825 [Cavenderia fasciculata]|uniref:Transmembrane protein n=1 Tax=Cavenderia fasciculata TaxID=261658 RepID=F4PLT9_CACFS|nr:uncharacterized protein DFA_04825 [Cavenderia fasciculata]EGG22695.1 hypothetical protein DFA_04825 [Cavenderia fasciculata]|eukprot:XP_004360546.1 hypothetical protein DFA_04825 [Cavenderia fasciculata]